MKTVIYKESFADLTEQLDICHKFGIIVQDLLTAALTLEHVSQTF